MFYDYDERLFRDARQGKSVARVPATPVRLCGHSNVSKLCNAPIPDTFRLRLHCAKTQLHVMISTGIGNKVVVNAANQLTIHLCER